MGATRFVYLDENAGKTVAPYMSQQLEMGSDLIGKDEDIPEDEVECKLPLEEMRMLKDEQEKLDSRSPETEAIVPAVTPADLLNVGDVLFNLDGAGSDENKSYRAAMTLRAIRETDMFELFSSQVENKKLIEELMERYVDEEGNALPLKKRGTFPNLSQTGGSCSEKAMSVMPGNPVRFNAYRIFYHVQRGYPKFDRLCRPYPSPFTLHKVVRWMTFDDIW